MTRYYPLNEGDAAFRRTHHARATGEFRPPHKGELFLSSTLATLTEVHRARTDLTDFYHIAEIVRTKTIITVVEDIE